MKKFIFLVVVLLLLASLERKPSMAINLTSGKYLEFIAPTTGAITQSTHLFWIYTSVDPTSGAPFVHQIYLRYGTGKNGGQYCFNPNVSGNLQMTAVFSTTNGLWRATTPSANTLYMITISYDGSSTSNVPVVTYNGVSQAVTTITAPVGTYTTTDNGNIEIGNDLGRFYNYLIYNRILSADEIAEAYATRKAIPTYRGLVFAPAIWAGGSVGEGGTMTATITDQINGNVGTPIGSPTFTQDAVLTFP